MSDIRVLIVDDEPLARERLVRLLGQEDGLELVGECGDGKAALKRLREGGVDLVFIDMEMPGASGLEVLAKLPDAERPAVIFATAHENFALDAFDLQAVDYLLKPFDQERFQQALRRAREALAARAGDPSSGKVDALLAKLSAREAAPERLTFKVDGRVIFLKPEEITRVEAADNYVVLHLTGGGRHMLRETMTAIEKRLGTGRFLRINRSALVQTDQIKELQPGSYGDYTVLLQDGTKLPLSRSLRGNLDSLFGSGD